MRLAEIDLGCRGQQVQMLQHLLNTTGRTRPALDLDGVFGPRTDRAVRQYQQGRSLAIDGVVGARTWSSLGASAASLPPPRVTPTAANRVGGNPVGTPTRSVSVPSIRLLPRPADFATSAGRQPVQSAASPTHAAKATTAAVRPASPKRTPALSVPPGTSISAPWMGIAKAEMFVAEVAGRGNNARIMEYHATTTLGSQPDSVPWCSSFVNWCLRQAGIRGTNSAAAASWVDWGQSLDAPRYGCIIQIRTARRGHDRSTGSSSGNHVAFFVSKTATHITLLGGNQSDQVKESSFRLSSYDIRGMRWPTGG